MKTSKEYLEEANATVPRKSAADVLSAHGNANALFIDVRDSASIADTGTIAGAMRLPRGMIEFVADDASPLHNNALKKDADIYLVCGAGGQAALAGKTLQDMGYQSITNIGGIKEWQEANGPMES